VLASLNEPASMQEILMANAECSTDCQKPRLARVIIEDEAWTGTTRAGKRQAVARPSRRLNRVSLGFWLGGATFGIGGCIIGCCMPYHHPVAVAIGVMWWGIYIGCLGASLGALFGLLTQCAPSHGQTEAGGHSPPQSCYAQP